MQSTLSKVLRSVKTSDDNISIEAEFSFSAEEPIFAGHFPGKPIIPAVYQLGLCRTVIEQQTSYSFAGISKSRFSKMCVPGVPYTLKISFMKKDNEIEAVCSIINSAEKALCSKLHLLYKA
jgi:3-hydroxymyristoyl/3-hydroxydecanoyl-(acyl carrier protein) dehydratase